MIPTGSSQRPGSAGQIQLWKEYMAETFNSDRPI